MKKNNLYYYVSCNNRSGVIKTLKNAGYKNIPKDREQASLMLADFVRKDGTKALKKIALIHPDRELLFEDIELKSTNKSADGIGLEEIIGVDSSVKTSVSDKTLNTLIISGASILALTMLVIVVTSTKK